VKACLIFLTLLALLVMPIRSSQATLFPSHDDPNVEVIYLEDPLVDLAIRNRFISDAKSTIDLVSFSHPTDEVGGPLLRSLRGALARGVRVRSARLLMDTRLSCQANIICATVIPKISNGLAFDDYIHEKILIIDAGTPDVKIVFGGRNHGKTMHDFGDSAFLLRPIDSSKPWAGDDVIRFYDQFWSGLERLFKKVKASKVSERTLAKLDRYPEVALRTEAQRKRFEKILQMTRSNAVVDGPLEPFQFRPQTFQLASNDLLLNAAKFKAGVSVDSRSGLPNDTLDLLHSLVPHADSVLLSGYAIGLPEPLASDFVRHVRSGKKLQVVTNGREAFHAMTRPNTPSRWMGNAAADYTLKNVASLMEAGDRSKNPVKLYLLNTPKKAGIAVKGHTVPDAYKYLHRKLIVMDDWVATGSDNWTASSARKNDEIAIVMKDSRMAGYLRNQIKWETDAYYTQYNTEAVKAELKSRAWFSKFYSNCLQSYIRRAF
jgi:phosphatidylserine/phosphatidylglycerophosphate/cardiolipin synthase-like enzyme